MLLIEAIMPSERNSSIITAYTLLFTVASGIVAEDLWTQRNPPPVSIIRKSVPAETLAAAPVRPAGPVLAQTDVSLLR